MFCLLRRERRVPHLEFECWRKRPRHSGCLARVSDLYQGDDVTRMLADSTVERFKKKLKAERVRLQRLIEEYEQELREARLTESSSDRSPEPGNAEAGSMKFEYEKELSIEQNTLDLLGKVERALERVDQGSYGICESCGNAIPLERLDVLPYTTFCVDCSRKN